MAGRIYDNFLGLGMTVVGTGDVQQSGGAYQGFAFQRGGIGYGAASTSPLALGPTVNPVYVDEYGLVVYDVLNGQNQQTNQVNAIAFMGFALGSTDVFFQRRPVDHLIHFGRTGASGGSTGIALRSPGSSLLTYGAFDASTHTNIGAGPGPSGIHSRQRTP